MKLLHIFLELIAMAVNFVKYFVHCFNNLLFSTFCQDMHNMLTNKTISVSLKAYLMACC